MHTSTSLTEQLGIPMSTFRRWCKALEEAGHNFERQQNRRVFHDQELKLFKGLQLAMLLPGMQLEEACERLLLIEKAGKRGAPSVETATLTCPKAVAPEVEHALERFESMLIQLPERIYWLGADQAIKELQVSYNDYKERLSGLSEKGA